MKLTDLKPGDKIIVPFYDDQPAIVERVDSSDEYQPVYVVWEDGTTTWPEAIYDFTLVKE